MDAEGPDWEDIVKEATPWSGELVDRVAREESWAGQFVMMFECEAETNPVPDAVGWPPSERGTGAFLEGERDRAPMVCPMVVVFPDSWT